MKKSPTPKTTPTSGEPVKKSEPVKISAAKGRPMLTWVGKRPLKTVTAFPAQHIESFHPTGEKKPGGLLFHGDNKEVLAWLLANGYRGKVDLIYIDPPFDSGADYVRKVTLRGVSGVAKLGGENYSLGEQIQYTDIWANDNYLQFMYERLLLLKELMSEGGSIYLHCDPSRNSYIRCIMDEIFGAENFQNEIIWRRQSAHSDSAGMGFVHDTIYFYTKGPKSTWNEILIDPSPDYIDSFFDSVEPQTGRRYARGDLSAGGLTGGGYSYTYKGVHATWRCPITTLEKFEAEGRLHWPKKGIPRLKRYLDEFKGVPIQDVWSDIRVIHNQSDERLDYPTQKPEPLLERILKSSSMSGGIILDCFLGSGTTAAVAQKLGRRWIGCDINKGAIQTTSKRLQAIIQDQITESEKPKQKDLIAKEEDSETPPPAALGFDVHRVNDYDLQIQHNEAVNLACEHIGVTRTKADSYFDGVQGKRLVKIIPFGHPLSPLHLEELKRELKARKNEERDILIVCLGKELKADEWLGDWNRLRKKGDVPNKIEVIELRTDAKYGKFIQHQPCQAKVKISRKKEEIEVVIHDFISPSILERLSQQAGILKPTIEDWRSMVDCVLIDPAYDGETFRIALSDLPEKKTDLVQGSYTLPATKGKATVAVKMIDMLGEEVLILQEV